MLTKSEIKKINDHIERKEAVRLHAKLDGHAALAMRLTNELSGMAQLLYDLGYNIYTKEVIT